MRTAALGMRCVRMVG